MTITHSELCQRAGKWLKRHDGNAVIYNCPVVGVELVTAAGEQPDALGFSGEQSVLVEVKVNRADFLKDKKKCFRKDPEKGMGEFRIYCCPKGLIKVEELPDKWGLLEWDGKKLVLTVKPKKQVSNLYAERLYLMSLIRREQK